MKLHGWYIHWLSQPIVSASHRQNLQELIAKIKMTYRIISFNFLLYSFSLLLHRIKHANIVSLEEIFESKSHLYLVMQLWVFTCVGLCDLLFCFFCAMYVSNSLLVLSPTHCMSHAINCTLVCAWPHTSKHCTLPTHEHQWGVRPHTCSLSASHPPQIPKCQRESENERERTDQDQERY